MLTISLFWFGVLVLMSAVLGYLVGVAYSEYIGQTEYQRGATDAVQIMNDHLARRGLSLYDNNDNDDNQSKARMGFDTTQKGETK